MSKHTILIIDDDPAQHEILEVYLSAAGFVCHHAKNSKEGMAELKSNTVSLILLDINMPEINGFQTIELLRKTPDTAEIPVLFLTSLDRQYLKVKGLNLGADDYITKPFNGAELVARIKAILRRKKSHSSKNSALSGDIGQIGFSDLIQNISQSGKNGNIEFTDMDGELTVEGENIVSARQGNHRGLEALLRLILLDHGHFAVSYQKISTPKKTKGIPVIRLLMTHLNEIDQIKKAISETTGQKNPSLQLVGELSGDQIIDAQTSLFPCRFYSVAVAMKGKLTENVYKLLKAIHMKKIHCTHD